MLYSRFAISVYFIVLLIFIFLNTLYNTGIVYGENRVSRITIDMEYIPEEDTGIVSMDVKYSGLLRNTLVSIPLLPNANVEIVSVEDGNGNELLYSVEKNTVNVYANNTDEVAIRYTVSGLIEEIGVGAYVLSLNLTPYEDVSSFRVNLLLLDKYNVSVPLGEAKVEYTDNTTKITMNEPQNYIIIIRIPAETPPATTGGGGVAGKTTTIPPVTPWGTTLLWIIAAIAVAVAAYLIYRYKSAETVVVTIPPGRLLEDETVKEIILTVGNAGPQGIKQSQLVRLTGKPKSTISRRVRKLAEEGYLEIIRSGKYNIIKLTSKGYESYKELRKELRKK